MINPDVNITVQKNHNGNEAVIKPTTVRAANECEKFRKEFNAGLCVDTFIMTDHYPRVNELLNYLRERRLTFSFRTAV